MDELKKPDSSTFDQIRQTKDDGTECWSSREFAKALGYEQYRNFEQVIEKAKTACAKSKQNVADHFAEVSNMIPIGKGAHRAVMTTMMSRYACYLAIQNADPSKPIVAIGQTYFAVQTRRQELSEEGRDDESAEADLRLQLRQEMKVHNAHLAGAAKAAGVVESLDYAIFQNHGYQGLYGGLENRDIHRRKGLKEGQAILDHMGSTELAANLFRATQTEEKLRRDKIIGKDRANQTHKQVGAAVRKTINDLGGTMPENLPTPAESIKQLESKRKKQISGK